MPDLFLVQRDDGSCAKVRLSPYPVVTSADADVTVTATTDPTTGQVTYDLAVATTVDINVDNVGYDAATNTLTVTETDGTVHNVDLSDLVDPPSSVSQTVTVGNEVAVHDDGSGNTTPILESVTAMADNNDGSFTHTAEDGTQTTISLCDLLDDVPDAGFYDFT